MLARLVRALGSTVGVGLCLVAPSAAPAYDFIVRSFDGTPIAGHFYAAAGLQAGARAPTVLVGPGWGGGGDRNPEGSNDFVARFGVGALRHAGYNVLTWDPRGFGASGDAARFDSADFEGRDVQALIDWLSREPAAQLDRPGDPRVGMTGGSYGGGIQFVTAAIDSRIEAIVPLLAWHSPLTFLDKDDTLKTGWLASICVNGAGPGVADGLFSPAGPQLGSLDPHIWDACLNGLPSGRLSPATGAWLESRGPGTVLMSRVRAPTLIIQGTSDSLVTLDEAAANYRILRGNGVPVRMMWFCGGHGLCLTSRGPPGHVEKAILRWLDRYVKRDRRVDPGPAFEWIDQNGTWHPASAYPLPRAGEIVATGSGTLVFTPADTSGTTTVATPGLRGVTVDVPSPPAAVDVAGNPVLELAYSGTATRTTVRMFAQIVDVERGIVVGNQATPIPLVLDGQAHTVTRSLEAVALRLGPPSRLRLQIVPGTLLYAPQLALGTVRFSRISLSLPVAGDPQRARGACAARHPTRAGRRSTRTGRTPRARVRVRCVRTARPVRVRRELRRRG